jgi:hypothetical protein
MPRWSPDIGLVVFGAVVTVLAALAGSTCTSHPTVGGVPPDCSNPVLLLSLGVVVRLVGVGVIALFVGRPPAAIPQPFDPLAPPPSAPSISEALSAEKGEVARIRCGYCGNLRDKTVRDCPSCGAVVGRP